MKACYIVHPTFWTKAMVWFFATFTYSNIKNKIRSINGKHGNPLKKKKKRAKLGGKTSRLTTLRNEPPFFPSFPWRSHLSSLSSFFFWLLLGCACQGIRELHESISPDQLDIPEFIVRHDELINGVAYQASTSQRSNDASGL
jgi:hypothetical protein